MKTVFRFLNMGLLLGAVTLAGATFSFAQDACDPTAQADAQTKINGIYKTDLKQALDLGKQYLEKFGSCPDSAAYVSWLKGENGKVGRIEAWEKAIAAQAEAQKKDALFTRFDNGIKSKNYDEVYAAGGELVSTYPNDPGTINLLVPMALIGYRQSAPPAKNYKYNDQAIKYANMAIAKLKAGDPGTKKNAKGQPTYGAFEFELTKDDAISEMTYGLGYINYWAKGDKKAALPYYYESLQMPGIRKDEPYSYATIGGFYQDEVGRLGKQYADLVASRSASDTPEAAAEKETKIKDTEALLKGYLDRAIDAYSRAWKATTDKTLKDGYYKTLSELYKARFQKTDGLDTYIATTTAKPMPNPSTDVTPVVEADPATNNNTTTSGAPAVTKPATTPTKPVSTTATAKVSADQTGIVTKTETATPATKTAAKKPVVKKTTR